MGLRVFGQVAVSARVIACPRFSFSRCHGSGRQFPRTSVAVASDVKSLFGGEDFYTILGVLPGAETRDIKRAYHALMRQFHPDRAPEKLRDDMASLCVLLNEIYETLRDEDKRAMYDTLAGFSSNAVNPFLDSSFPRDQIAIECCPVDCIHWVSLPQLSLLEAALARMGRIEVSVMQRFGRSGGNVFQVAYKAWEQRMAVIQERAAATVANGRVQVDWSFWTNGASLQFDKEAERRALELDPEQRHIANLAASAARAARMWRFYSQTMGAGRVLLTDSSTSSLPP